MALLLESSGFQTKSFLKFFGAPRDLNCKQLSKILEIYDYDVMSQ